MSVMAGRPDLVLLWSLRLWRAAGWAASFASLAVCVGLPPLLAQAGRIGAAAALAATAGAVLIWGLGIAIWHRAFLPRVRAALLRPGTERVARQAAALPGVRDLHSWTGAAPGVIALRDDGLWLCCAATRFTAVHAGPGCIEAVHVYGFTTPVLVGLLFGPQRGLPERSVAIPFGADEAAARRWHAALLGVLRSQGPGR